MSRSRTEGSEDRFPGHAKPSEFSSVFRVSAQQLQGMGNQLDHGFERFDRARWLSGKIENHRRATHPADGAAEGGELGGFRAFRAHAFSNAFQQAVADRARSLGSDVAGRNAGAPGGDYEAGLRTQTLDRVDDCRFIIRNDFAGNDTESPLLESSRDGRAAEVFAFSAR